MRPRLPRPVVHALITGIATGIVALWLFLETSGRLRPVLLEREYWYRDLVTKTSRFNSPDQRLVYLAIDSGSISLSDLDLQTLYRDVPAGSQEARALELLAEGWPWSREVYALLADRLLRAGAKTVVLDLLLPKPGRGDEALRQKLEELPERIILGSNFVPELIGGGRRAWTLMVPVETVVPPEELGNRKVGYVNFWPDADGVVRSVQYRATLEQLQADIDPVNLEPNAPAALALLSAQTAGAAGVSEPAQPKLIRFSGPPGTFVPIPLYQVFLPLYWQQNFDGGRFFQDKIVLVGPYGNWAQDEHATPFGQMPGPELQLNSINALLHRAFLYPAPAWSGYLLLAGGGMAAWLLGVLIKRVWWRVAAIILVGGAFLFAVKVGQSEANLVVLAIPPVVVLALAGLGAFVHDYTRETLEKLRIRRTLESYVSEAVVREVLDNPASYMSAVGGTRAQVALLMTDLRGFTTISEQMDSTVLVAQLNEYLSAMVDDIFNVRGSVDKFVGDAILAVWGHLNSAGATEDAAHAVHAFFRMRESLARLNKDWQRRGMRTFEMGCGINYGEVTFGNIGSTRKMEPTVIGDPVNVVARLEGLTKDYGRDVLLGEAVANLVKDSHQVQFIDRVAVKGKTKPLDVFSVLAPSGDGDQLEDSTGRYLETYRAAQEAYQNRLFEEAAELFRSCLQFWPGDTVASIYLKRCAEFMASPPPADWDRVHVMTHK